MLLVALTSNFYKSHWLNVVLLILILNSCSQFHSEKTKRTTAPLGHDLRLTKVDYSDLPGWENFKSNPALRAFLESCKKLSKIPRANLLTAETNTNQSKTFGRGNNWHDVCVKAKRLLSNLTVNSVKHYFEEHFIPYKVSNGDEDAGLITGYFEPYLMGSKKPTPEFSEPLYRLPNDLVVVNLGKYKKEWRGQKLIGKLNRSELVPYDDRAKIQKGALKGRGLELYWVNDPVESFFLHIQGSGLIILPDGKKERVGYAGKNGQPYFAIGRELIARGSLKKHQVSLQTIRTWLKTNPSEAQKLMNKNKSYIFFRKIKGPGPIGAQGVPLTAGHSLAVDRQFFPLGVPIWLDSTDPLNPDMPIRRLVIAQDTGGAIKGIVRADLFWGAGDRARLGAGKMREKGHLYVLLPRSISMDAKR